jgi:CubicO group peptidase (beta-lactamase class C family)
MTQITTSIKMPLCLLAVIITCFLHNYVGAQDTGSKMDDYMRAHVEQKNFSGCILVAAEGKIVIAKSYGMANYEHEIPNATQTKFQIGSMTKSFTALAIMLLKKRGVLSLDDAVAKYLPDFPYEKKITIRHLLTHTSGLPRIEDIPDHKNIMAKNLNLEDVLGLLYKIPGKCEPATEYSYNNAGYMLLAEIIEKTTGKKYGDFLKEQIFDPCGMQNTLVPDSRALIENRAYGYNIGGNASLENADYENLYAFQGASGIYSTAGDLYLLDQALYKEELLDKESLMEMFAPQAGGRYGYGWVISVCYDHRMVWHDGSTLGYQSFMARFPDDNACIIILSNFIHAPISMIQRDLAAILFGKSYVTPETPASIAIDTAIYNYYPGKYKLENDDIVTITKEDNRLFGEALSAPMKFELFPVAPDRFTVKIREGVGFTFKKDSNNHYNAIVLHWGSTDISGIRIE